MRALATKYKNKMITALRNSIEKRLSVFESRELYTQASLLDPRFKLKWCKDGQERASVKETLLNNIETFAAPDQEGREDAPRPSKRQRLDEDDDILEFMGDVTVEANIPLAGNLPETDACMAQPCTDRASNPLQF